MLRKSLETAEDQAFWHAVGEMTAEVQAWPAWKRAALKHVWELNAAPETLPSDRKYMLHITQRCERDDG